MCSGEGYQNDEGTQVKTMSHKEHSKEIKMFYIKNWRLRKKKPDI